MFRVLTVLIVFIGLSVVGFSQVSKDGPVICDNSKGFSCRTCPECKDTAFITGPAGVIDLGTRSTQSCGVERQPVKTLSDDDVKLIHWETIKQSTVDEVTKSIPPTGLKNSKSQSHRVSWEEKVVWQITGDMIGLKLESDGDYHIVLRDRTNHSATMVVEIPSPDCIAEPYKNVAAHLRSAISNAFEITVTEKYKAVVPLPVVITGVGFFDFIHGQKGVAKNGFEIHPVTQLEYDEPDENHHVVTAWDPCLVSPSKTVCDPKYKGNNMVGVSGDDW